MERREFLATGVAGLGAQSMFGAAGMGMIEAFRSGAAQDLRALFPRLAEDVYVNAAAGTPLGAFATEGLERYMAYQRLGRGDGRLEYFTDVTGGIRELFAALIGADESEIALVHCTKQGEQIVLDSLDGLRTGGNVVTNDFHFTGSLHNLLGLRAAGMDVRIVRSRDWDVDLQDMLDAIDDRTEVVVLSLVSNINGRHEPIREIADAAHARGAWVYADIIQAAGITPIDVRTMGIDFAACSGYKWLYGVHGVGFFFVRQELQGTVLRDRLYPGHVRHNYRPWVNEPDAGGGDFHFAARSDASRYEPGHVSYLGYCALYEGLKFLEAVGMGTALSHTLRLNRRLASNVDRDRFRIISPEGSPILTLLADEPDQAIAARLRASNVVVSLGNQRVRISPALYNDDADIDRVLEALNGPGQ